MNRRWLSVVVAILSALTVFFGIVEGMEQNEGQNRLPDTGRWITECVDCPANTGVVSLTGGLQSLNLAVDSQDYAHIAYYQGDWDAGHLGYAYIDATGWHVEIVDTKMAGYPYPGISLALDANDVPHVSYYSYDSDTNVQALRYAYRDESGWQIEAVGDVGTYTSLVIDEKGAPHISYQNMTGGLMYAYRDTNGWITQTVHLRTKYLPRPTALALDSDGTPHIGYIASSKLRYANLETSDWSSHTVDTLESSNDGLSIALDDVGYAHISYDHEGDDDLRYAYENASGWHTSTVDSKGQVGGYPSLALEEIMGYARVSYYDDTNTNLKYAYEDASGWQTQTLDSRGDVGKYTSLDLDGAGYAHIAYYDASNEQLKYAYEDNSGWYTQTVTPYSRGYVGLYTSLALDEQEDAHISYYDWSQGNLKYACRDASGWYSQVVDNHGDVGLYTSLALDGEGYPHISYYDATQQNLKYAYQDDSGWYSQTVDSAGDVGHHTSLALETTAPYTVHISYYDATNQHPKYAHQTATGWHVYTVGTGFPGGQYPSLALEDNGNPHISYFEHYFGDLLYIERTGPTTWLSSTVDYHSESGDEVGRFSSLALAANEEAHISYYDNASGNLKYAHGYAAWPTAGWPNRETVDRGGGYTSLALDSDGEAHISHYDWITGNLKYVYQNASGWYSLTVAHRGNVGLYTSLALDQYDHAHISYYDATQANLKYAYYTTNTLPGMPTLSHPPNGFVTTGHAITFSWQAGPGLAPDGYNMRLDNEVITTTATTSPTLLALGVHTWTVRAYNTDGHSAWASQWNINILESVYNTYLPLVLRMP